MLFKKILAAAALAGILVCTGCGDGGDDDRSWLELEGYSEPDEQTEEVVTSSYIKYLSDSVYKYLNIYEISDGTVAAQVFLPGNEALNNMDGTFSAELHGVSVAYEMITGEASPVSVVSTAYRLAQSELAEDRAVQNIQATDLITAASSDWAIQEIDYETVKNGAVYQCYEYIKADALTDDAIILSIVTVDSSASDGSTAAVVSEVLEATGIVVNDEEEAAGNAENEEATTEGGIA